MIPSLLNMLYASEEVTPQIQINSTAVHMDPEFGRNLDEVFKFPLHKIWGCKVFQFHQFIL